MAGTAPRSVRLDANLLSSLQSLARAQHRTLNNLIQTILSAYVEEHELLATDDFKEALREAEGDEGIPWRQVLKDV